MVHRVLGSPQKVLNLIFVFQSLEKLVNWDFGPWNDYIAF